MEKVPIMWLFLWMLPPFVACCIKQLSYNTEMKEEGA